MREFFELLAMLFTFLGFAAAALFIGIVLWMIWVSMEPGYIY